MTIYISNTAYNLTTDTRNRPILAWHSVITLPNILAYNALDGRPASNMWSPDTATFWQGNGTANFIILVNPGAQEIDYVGIAKHNLGSGLLNYVIEKSDDNATYTEVVALKAIASDGAIVDHFDPITSAYIRITFSAASGDSHSPIIGHIRAGRVTVLERKIFVDHAPSTLVKKATRVAQTSESGQYLGAIVTRTNYGDSIKQENNSESFVRNSIVPFASHANCTRADNGTAQGTFFFAWRPTSFPNEILYGWTGDNISPEYQRNNGMMRWSCSVEGIA